MKIEVVEDPEKWTTYRGKKFVSSTEDGEEAVKGIYRTKDHRHAAFSVRVANVVDFSPCLKLKSQGCWDRRIHRYPTRQFRKPKSCLSQASLSST